MKKIERVLLTQPNFHWLGKRSYETPPYGLALLNAVLRSSSEYESYIYDPNFYDYSEERVRRDLRNASPDVIGITSYATEYIPETKHLASIIKEELPETIVVLGGIIPTVLIEAIIDDTNFDYFILGEGEYRFPKLLDALNHGEEEPTSIDGLAYFKNGRKVIIGPSGFIEDLDAIPFADYTGNVGLYTYGMHKDKYNVQYLSVIHI